MRAIRLPQATALVAGTVIGVAIFVQPAEIARQVGSPAEFLAVWIAGGALALIGALLCAELASTFEQGGGVYRYLTEAYGPAAGFLWSWALFWTIHTSIIAAVAMVFARSLIALLPGATASGVRPLAIAAILLLTAVNIAGTRRGAGLQTGLAALKVTVLIGLAIAGLWVGGGAGSSESVASAPMGSTDVAERMAAWGGALVAALFTFGGWHLVTFPTAETDAPRQTLPRAILLGFAIVVATYVALNLAYVRLLGLEGIARSPHVAASAAEVLAEPAGRVAVAALAALSSLGALAGLVLVGPRIYFAAAKDGVAPAWLGAVHSRRHTPHRALMAQALWASTLVLFGTYGALYTRAVVVEWTFFALLGVAVVVLRRRGFARRFSLPLHPVLPCLFALAALALVLERTLSDPAGSALGWLPVAAGIPVYVYLRRRRNRAEARGEGVEPSSKEA